MPVTHAHPAPAAREWRCPSRHPKFPGQVCDNLLHVGATPPAKPVRCRRCKLWVVWLLPPPPTVYCPRCRETVLGVAPGVLAETA